MTFEGYFDMLLCVDSFLMAACLSVFERFYSLEHFCEGKISPLHQLSHRLGCSNRYILD